MRHAHLFQKYNVCGQLLLGSVLALKVDLGLMSSCLLVYLDYWTSSGYVYMHKQCFKLIFCFQSRPFWQLKITKRSPDVSNERILRQPGWKRKLQRKWNVNISCKCFMIFLQPMERSLFRANKNTTIKQLATFAAERTPRQLAISTTSLVDIFFFSLWQPT